jgi:hypothetical protein
MMRHELCREFRPDIGCEFVLLLTFDAGPDETEISFTELYEYPARPDNAGREYAYSILVAGRDIDRLVKVVTGRCDRPAGAEDSRAVLLESFRDLVENRLFGAHLERQDNVGTLGYWLDGAAIAHREDRWAWMDSD